MRRLVSRPGWPWMLAIGILWTLNAPVGIAAPPNIVLVLADDMVWRDCEPYGNPQVSTPNLARLAREGVCFDAMFTGTAMCSPSRQQLYTGLFPVRNGAFPNHSRVHAGVRSLPHHLQRLGYRVGLMGKTHFGPREAFPFEPVGPPRGNSGRTEFDPDAIERFVLWDTEQPFCLVICSQEPHVPWNRGDADAYFPDTLVVPPYLVDCPATRENLAKYYAEITYLDGQLGAVLEVLGRTSRTDSTLTIFTSEQGSQFPFGGKWTCYDTGLKTAFIARWPGKIQPGSRTNAMAQYVDVVPTLIEAAGGDPAKFDPGRPDVQGQSGFDGRSLLSVLLGQTDTHREFVYGIHTTRGIIDGSECYPIRSVRSRRWKYIRNLNHEQPFENVVTGRGSHIFDAWREEAAGDPLVAARVRAYQHRPAEELYDLQRDPWELQNLADDPARAEVKAKLAAELRRFMAQQGDQGNATERSVRHRKR